MSKKIKKRDFLKVLMLSAMPGVVDRANAISILEDIKSNSPNQLELDVIGKPQKQILLAEKMSCPFSPIMKAKCISIS